LKGGSIVNISTEDTKNLEASFEARKLIMHIINSLSPSNKLKGVSIDDIVNYGETLGLHPEVTIGVAQQFTKEELITETSKNRFLNKYPPLSIERAETPAIANIYDTLELSSQTVQFRNEEELEEMSELLKQSNLVITPEQLSQIREAYEDMLKSGNPDMFFKGYPSDTEIGKRVGVDKRKVQGARALLGLLNERDLKMDFNRDKLVDWLLAPKAMRMRSKEFAEELGVSYSTFKRKKALWEAFVKMNRYNNK
jgi:hypothetical protein